MVIPRFVERAMRGDKLKVYGDGKQSHCFLHVEDAVAGIVALAETPAAVEHMRILDDRIAFVPYKEAYADGFEDMRRRVPNTAKLTAYTGWQQGKSLQQTLDDVIEEFAAHFTMPVAAAAD